MFNMGELVKKDEVIVFFTKKKHIRDAHRTQLSQTWNSGIQLLHEIQTLSLIVQHIYNRGLRLPAFNCMERKIAR